MIGQSLGTPVPPPDDLVILNALELAARAAGLPYELVQAVAYIESRYNPLVESSAGARGLMQLMPAHRVEDWRNPVENAKVGAMFLAKLYRKYGDWHRALAAYNWGPARVDAKPEPSQWPAQVRGYVLKVWKAAGWPVPFSIPVFRVEGR